jgi:hypothetical protein
MNRDYSEVADKFEVILRLLGFKMDSYDAEGRFMKLPVILAAAYLSIIGCLAENVDFASEYRRIAELDKTNWAKFKVWVGIQSQMAMVGHLKTWRRFFGDDTSRAINNDNIITMIPRMCVSIGIDAVISMLKEYRNNKKYE